MAFRPIIHNGKHLKLHRSIKKPDFNSKLVLATDTWNYVQMWLASNRLLKDDPKKEALFHWEQAKHFFNASVSLPATSSPLTAYYATLNATKTLLIVKSVQYSDYHGVAGSNDTNAKTSLSNIQVKQIADYVKELEEGLVEWDYDQIAMQAELPYLYQIIQLLMDATYKTRDQRLKPLLATIEYKARKCKQCIEERLAVRN